MNRAFPALACASLALITSLAVSTAGLAAAKKPAARPNAKSITCPFLANGRVSFDVPAKEGDLPKEIDFDYDAKAVNFSFREGNLFLLAVDEGHPTRVRIMISAQLNKKSGAYEGQIFTDTGGNQLMLDNGPVRCTVEPY
ncbi:MAG: hypothetical protein JO000_29120 [Alphaproteobacteria bacterium]|nr:hypothetical protein [Alphaproteobacteria bacterium]